MIRHFLLEAALRNCAVCPSVRPSVCLSDCPSRSSP